MVHKKRLGNRRGVPKNPIAAARVAENRAKADERRQAAWDRHPPKDEDEESES